MKSWVERMRIYRRKVLAPNSKKKQSYFEGISQKTLSRNIYQKEKELPNLPSHGIPQPRS
jgi:hypothetical protein